MNEVNWNLVKHFPELKSRKDIEGVKPKLVYTIDDFREILGSKIIVSPIVGAIVANSGHAIHSRHYKGEAIDVFPQCHAMQVIFTLMNYNPWGGIGIYFDTHLNGPEIMFHFDIRERKPNGLATWWFRDEGKYYYLGNFKNDESEFLNAIFERINKFYN